MRIDDIKNLNYNGFKKNRKKIEKYINNYLKNTEITYYEEIAEKINFILWGSNDIGLLKNQNKYIFDAFYQTFYVNKNEPGFIIELVDGTVEFEDDDSEKFTNLKIKIKKLHYPKF
ncbi:hypothetical protein AXY43_16040 [Clostridium sp. MF28]|uniref:hypothetical protein n=1 Tax=Clostridium TaxID=1485 RepID=UPI000CF94E5A|nr:MULTISPECIES: hypothetical protein [Clostridium]AVK49386.1 hypothetical protein AXY43_16040 [Clostridium sp. MF28]PSM57997.1 hypothetical protein C4L39_09270 [Clostridium diolis]